MDVLERALIERSEAAQRALRLLGADNFDVNGLTPEQVEDVKLGRRFLIDVMSDSGVAVDPETQRRVSERMGKVIDVATTKMFLRQALVDRFERLFENKGDVALDEVIEVRDRLQSLPAGFRGGF